MVTFKGVGFHREQKQILKELSFEIKAGQIFGLLGESGSGKTTTLKLINGLIQPSHGSIQVFDQPIDYSKVLEMRHKIGYSVQGGGLFPHLDVLQNISLLAKLKGWSADRCRHRAIELLNLVELESSYLKRMPSSLSGGQRQRVDFVRALFLGPELLLMDEPFSALDPLTKAEIQNQFLKLQRDLKFSALIVTHDLQEALALSDQVLLLKNGTVEQQGRISDLMNKPATTYVKQFVAHKSPSQVLQNFKLQNIFKNDIWVRLESQSALPILAVNIRTNQEKEFIGESDYLQFLQSLNQTESYLVTNNFILLKVNNSDFFPALKLRVSESVLDAVRWLLSYPMYNEAPVFSDDGSFVGVFSKEVLNVVN